MKGRNPFSNCRSCNQRIAWLVTTNKKPMPVDVSSLSESDKYELHRGLIVVFNKDRHTSHFATCPNANGHRKPKKKVDKAPVIYE